MTDSPAITRRRGRSARVSPRRAWTTRIVLRRLRLVLLAGMVLVIALLVTAFTQAQTAIIEAVSHTDAAIMDLSAARQALVDADASVRNSVSADTFGLLRPLADYEQQMSAAQTSLQHAAQVGVVSLVGIDGQLDAYIGQVDQASADFASGAVGLGSVEIDDYAHNLLTNGGLLTSLDRLIAGEKSVFADEVGSWWLGPWAMVSCSVPALLLFVLLVAVQWYYARRFHRRISWWLAGASALLVALCAGVAVVVGRAEHRLATASADADTVMADYGRRVAQGITNQDFAAATSAAAEAGAGYDLQYVIVGLGVCIAVLVWLGIWLPLRDYRYDVR